MTKTTDLFERLQAGWVTVPDMLEATKWKPHTLRAAIAVGTKKRGLKLERQRNEGITSYRVVDDYKPRDDFNKSINACYESIRDRIKNGGPGWEPK